MHFILQLNVGIWIYMHFWLNLQKFGQLLLIIVWILLKCQKVVVRVFANGPGDQGSIPSRVIPKTRKSDSWYLLA